MSNISTYGAELWTSALFDIANIPANYYIALVTSLPVATSDGTQLSEPLSTAGYGRHQISTDSASWQVNTSFSVSNIDSITFPLPTADWGTISGFVICTAVTAGEIICWGRFNFPLYIPTGIPLIIPAGTISIGLK